MVHPSKRRLAQVPLGADNPLNYAVAKRDQGTLDMVEKAIRHRQTLLAFQPVMLASDQTKIGFYEGFMRVLDPTGRVIPAGQFMPAVEATELGRELDVVALRMGLQALRRNPGLRLSINLSARSVGYGAWQKTLKRHLKSDPTIGERLILETTESSAMLVPELVLDAMDDLQPQGICFALDNYGAGHTAIRYFKDFLFDILKIDGQFVRGLSQDPDNQVITAALIAIANQFDMLTVAQSVERPEDAQLLAEMGVDCLQGYYFAAPTVQPTWMASQAAQAG